MASLFPPLSRRRSRGDEAEGELLDPEAEADLGADCCGTGCGSGGRGGACESETAAEAAEGGAGGAGTGGEPAADLCWWCVRLGPGNPNWVGEWLNANGGSDMVSDHRVG